MRLLVVGDFSGKPAADRGPIATRRTHRIDVDNFDAVFRRLEPRADVAGGISFNDIEDFHPDRLFAKLSAFRPLREARAGRPADVDDVLGRLLGKPAEPQATAPAQPAAGIDALIRNIVAPHIVKDTAAADSAHVAAVDAAIAEHMREVLHAPAFQSIEAVWRGARWLVSSLELDEHLQLHLFDVARDELLADIVSARGKLPETGFYRSVVDAARNAPDGDRWSALVALFRFGPSDADIGLLAALGLIAGAAHAPLLADGDLTLGDETRGLAGWRALRRSEAAPWIGLAAPRVLLRLPYGRTSDPVEAFQFEECVGPPAPNELLWGNAALAIALLLGRSFTARGWDMEPGDEREIGDLPAYSFVRDGEREMQPCAERFLSEPEMDRLIASGLMPIVSRRDRNSVVAVRFESVADPPAPLIW